MKAFCVALVLLASGVSAARLSDANKGSAIAAVITKLKKMLTDSKADWKSDKGKFEAFVTYCETNDKEKTEAIAEATTTNALLTNKIEELQGSTGDLSVKSADLKAAMAENTQAQDDANSLRGKEKKAYDAEKTDLDAAVGQMDLAITTLAAIGADQTSASRDKGDNAAFMGKAVSSASLVSIQSTVRQALMAANSFLAPEKQQKLTAFIQAPFTGTYTSQSGAIIGILKDMRDTFKTNLAESKTTEEASVASHGKFIKNKEDEHAKMTTSYNTKQADMGSNDGDLSTKKTQLKNSKKQKGEDEDFLADLTTQCKDKTAQYQVRKKFAANEEIALSKAIAILDNDVANEDFSAKTFLQLAASPTRRSEAAAFLQGNQRTSPRVRQVLLLLQAGNPFSVVLEQIDRMVTMADDEQKVDDEEKAWCTKTNKNNAKDLSDVESDLDDLEKEINKLKGEISTPKTGLKEQIKEAQDGLKANLKTQGDETKDRREANLEYQKDASTLNDVIETIAKAVDVLKSYYDSLDNEQIGDFLQISEDPAPPATFKGDYKGQNEAGKVVFGLLKDITDSTETEINSEHDAEQQAQHDYEDSMKSLTDAEADYEESIVELNGDLAKAEKDLEAKYEEETATEKQETAIKRYIAKLKPGCDFVLDNYATRKTSRAAEKTALEGAKTKLTGSPSYKAATQKAKEDAFGKCKATCLKSEAHVDCKSCLAGTSVPGYCAGHKGTTGC